MARLVVPDIGDTFTYHGLCTGDYHQSDSFRVTGWLKRAPVEHPECYRAVGPDKCPLVFCKQSEAEYVSGYGVCGVIVRVSEVEVTGRVPWSAELLASEVRMAARHIGTMVRLPG